MRNLRYPRHRIIRKKDCLHYSVIYVRSPRIVYPASFSLVSTVRNWNFTDDLGDRARSLCLSRRSAVFVFREVLTTRPRRRACYVLVYSPSLFLGVYVVCATRFPKAVDDVRIRGSRERRAARSYRWRSEIG